MKQLCDTPCREWMRSGSRYGTKWDKELKKVVKVHRWVVAQVHGWEAIEGRAVMHLCDNPLCYRYDHLRIGTQADNLADMASKGRHRNQLKTHCIKGHEFNETNTRYLATQRVCRVCDRERPQRRATSK